MTSWFFGCLPQPFDAVLVGSGLPIRRPLLRELVQRSACSIALDGGVNILHRLRIVPAAVIGDLDSASDRALDWARRTGATVYHRPTADAPDLAKGLAWCRAKGLRRVIIVGAFGDRIDHSLNALHLMLKARTPEITLITNRVIAFVLRGRVARQLRIPVRHTISWFGLTEAHGASLSGVRWPFQNRSLRLDGFHSLSNEPVDAVITLRQRSGRSLLVISLRPESGRSLHRRSRDSVHTP